MNNLGLFRTCNNTRGVLVVEFQYSRTRTEYRVLNAHARTQRFGKHLLVVRIEISEPCSHFGTSTTMPDTRSAAVPANQSSSTAESVAGQASSASDTPSTSLNASAPSPPLWEEFSAQDWDKFRNDFRNYQQKGGRKPANSLLSPWVLESLHDTLQILKGITIDLSNADDDTFFENVNKALAPEDKGQALRQLKTINMEEVSLTGFMRFTSRFKWEVKNIPLETKPTDELLVKTFISKLKPNQLKRDTSEIGARTFSEAYEFALKKAIALNNVGMMTTQSGKETNSHESASKSSQKQSAPRATKSENKPKQNSNFKSSKKGTGRTTQVTCFICDKVGHYARECPASDKASTKVPDPSKYPGLYATKYWIIVSP